MTLTPTGRAAALLLSLAALASLAVGCAAPPPSFPAGSAPPHEPALQQARALALRGGPSPTPHLDALCERLARGSCLGLAELLRDSQPAPDLSRLRPGDRLELVVEPLTELGRPEVTLSAAGTLPLASGAELRAAGLALAELEAKLAEFLVQRYLKTPPRVVVRVIERATREVQLIGRIGASAQPAPGEERLARSAALPLHRPLGLHELLLAQGGLSPDAAAGRLFVLREVEGQPRCYRFGFAELGAAQLEGREAWLRPGDRVVVPRLPDVYVLGAVARPGRYPLTPGTSAASLLLGAGGPLPGADSLRARWLSGEEVRPASSAEAPAPGEVLYVPQSPKVYVVGPGVRRNGSLRIPVGGLSVIQALSEAGWFTPTADRGGVKVLRRLAGARVELEVPVEALLRGERAESDFRLEGDDTLVVPEALW